LPQAFAQFGDFQFQCFEPLKFSFQPLDLEVEGVVAVLQKLILFEEKHDGDAASGGHLVPVVFTDSDLVERQHGVRLARLIGDVQTC
jgi:hypothetical protein